MYDVIIIGAGVSGSATARELSRYDLKVGVLEKEEDVCCGTSKANSGIVHAGFDARPGSLMAKMNVRGNQMMEQLAEDLDIPFERNGSLVLCFAKDEMERLKKQKEEAQKEMLAQYDPFGTQNDDPDNKGDPSQGSQGGEVDE